MEDKSHEMFARKLLKSSVAAMTQLFPKSWSIVLSLEMPTKSRISLYIEVVGLRKFRYSITASSETNKWVQHSFPFEEGVRVCGDAVLRYFLVQFCGNFYFNSRCCGFKTLSSLQAITTFRSRFSVKKCLRRWNSLERRVGIRLFCKREPSVLFYNASGFIISVYYLTLLFAITAFSKYVRFRYSGKNPMRFAVF